MDIFNIGQKAPESRARLLMKEARPGCFSLFFGEILRGVAHTIGSLDLPDHFPILLIGNWDEFADTGKLLAQGRALEVKGKEGLLDLLDQFRVQVMGVGVGSRGEGRRLPDNLYVFRIVK